jgi:hypothetical protein
MQYDFIICATRDVYVSGATSHVLWNHFNTWGQRLWVTKILLFCGDFISWVTNEICNPGDIYTEIKACSWGCQFVGKGGPQDPWTLVPHEQWWFKSFSWLPFNVCPLIWLVPVNGTIPNAKKPRVFPNFEAKNSQFICLNINHRADQHRNIFAVLNCCTS